MSAVYEGDRAFYMACAAHILDTSKEMAWAEKHVVENAAHKWILGRYAEADRANTNRQFFGMDNLKFGQPLLAHSPLNINHSPLIVGAYVASEIVYPTGEGAGEGDPLNPYLDALSVFWKHYFEDEYAVVETAHKAGRLFYSMECVPHEIACGGEAGCGKVFEYAGRSHATYCDHLNDPKSGVIKDLIQPHFTAGALIVPPVQPGWSRADIKQISEIVRDHAESAEALYSGLAEDAPEADVATWEQVMAQILLDAEASGELSEMKKKSKSKKNPPKGYTYGPNGELRHAQG